MPHSTNRRLVISGRFVELYFYEKDIFVGFPRLAKQKYYDYERPKRDQREIRNDSVSRTRSKIRRLVNSNREMIKFMTLTFNTPMLNLTKANPFFDRFIKRMNRRYKGWKYLSVPEFQSRSNRVHYHLLCDVEYIPKNELEKIWGQRICLFKKNRQHRQYGGVYLQVFRQS